MKHLYSRRATGELKALINTAAERSSERSSLAGEVDASRAIALQAIQLLDKTMEGGESTKPELLLGVMEFAQKALKHVNDSVATMVKVSAIDPTALDAEQADYILNSIGEILRKRVDDEKLRETILADFKDIKVPERKNTVQINIAS